MSLLSLSPLPGKPICSSPAKAKSEMNQRTQSKPSNPGRPFQTPGKGYHWMRRQKEQEIPPFRLGVWCDYHGTLTPYGGIGVFVYNLLEGILELDEAAEVVLPIPAPEDHVLYHLPR